MVTLYNPLYQYCKNVMLYDKVYNFIKENALITEKTVICAVSGGADSVCLLDVITTLAPRLGVSVECAHLNHNLRGDESDGDECYVRELCQQLSVPLHVKSVDVGAMAYGIGIEDAARRARYSFFDELTKSRSAQILTAHTVNDNTETFFINLLRGSGSRGLCAIPLRRGNISRPLLCTDRTEILSHLESRGLSYRTDSTNADTVYLRNFIRHEIIPRFYDRDGIDINNGVSRAVKNLQLENEALCFYAEREATDDVSKLRLLPDAVLYRVLNNALEKQFGLTLDSMHFEAVKQLLERDNSRVQLRGNLFALTEYGKLRFACVQDKNTDIKELVTGENIFNNKKILIKKTKEIYNALTNNSIDCAKISNSLYARTRRDGDVYHHPSRKVTSSLKKLLVNDKVSKALRDKLVIICDGEGNTVFVEGYGADARFAADRLTENIMEIEII